MKQRRATAGELQLLQTAIVAWDRLGYTIPGGTAARLRLDPLDFAPGALAIGTRVEMEHTSRPEVALEIAMAHLHEHPGYYAALEPMERALARRRR